MIEFPPILKIKLDGKIFGSWTVLRHSRRKNGRQYWLCRCKCGLEKEIESYTLHSGRSLSCRPCSAKVVAKNHHITHGKSLQKVYRTWQSIKTRCYNSKAVNCYRCHGALGVRVWEVWINNFQAFYEHIGDPPTPLHTIDRINVFGNYEPGNVRWATQAEQMANTRRSKKYKNLQPK